MRTFLRRASAFIIATMALCVWGQWRPASAATSTSGSTLHMIDVSGHRVAFHVVPGHKPIVVFDAGAGLDSSWWSPILPQIAEQTGSELITYDREGFGQSDEVAAPYHIAQSVRDLEAGLRQLGATRDVVLVAHSFAGEVDTFLAMKHPAWFAGAVLVDASIPNFFTDAETDHLFKGMQSLPLDTKEHRTTDAMIAAWPRFNRKFHKAIWPPQIPCIVIVSEQSPWPGTPDATLWRQAHLVFAHDAKNRQFIVATKSSHDVVRDRPDLVIQSIVKMVTEVKSAKN